LQQRLQGSGGHGEKKKTNSQSTGLIGSRFDLTGTTTGLTGAQTGLTGVSSKFENSSEAKNKVRPSIKELLAKYQKKRAAQEQKKCLNKAKNTKQAS